MAVPNAVNIEDAINGYMGGYTLIIMLFIFMHGIDTRIISGALIGFLLLNWPGGRHFMGDAGSLGCGFFIAEGILRSGGLTHPLIALAVTAPISMDVAMGLIRRQRLGMNFFTADSGTCPHHILSLMNGSAVKATPILWLNAAIFIFLSSRPIFLLGYTTLYAGVLVFLNRHQIFGNKVTKLA